MSTNLTLGLADCELMIEVHIQMRLKNVLRCGVYSRGKPDVLRSRGATAAAAPTPTPESFFTVRIIF
ncbi:unnamed protein product [Toxocara canis]|uniref:Uncharacterized protein n=1 Tax=Toxocara canis TaxID=6265 RepID=A0A183USK9_TOXCA|nr:unnamed protein product [Toxocara canis]